MKIRIKKFLVFIIFSLFATGQMVQAWPNLNSIYSYVNLNLRSSFNNKNHQKLLIPVGVITLMGLAAYKLYNWYNSNPPITIPINTVSTPISTVTETPRPIPINPVTELPHLLEILFKPPVCKDSLILTDINNLRIIVEKEIAMRCAAIATSPVTLKLPCTRTDFGIIHGLLKFFVPTLKPEEQQNVIKAILGEYSTETLIEILATSLKLQVPNKFFQIILEYATTRIFNIHRLDFLSNENVCALLKDPNLKTALIMQYLKQVPIDHWIYNWFTRLLNQLTIEQALFLLHVDHSLKTRPGSPIRIEHINKKVLIASYGLPKNYVQLLPENVKLHIYLNALN